MAVAVMMTFGAQGMGFQRVFGGCGGDLGVPVTSESLGGNLGEGVYIARDMIVRGQPQIYFSRPRCEGHEHHLLILKARKPAELLVMIQS